MATRHRVELQRLLITDAHGPSVMFFDQCHAPVDTRFVVHDWTPVAENSPFVYVHTQFQRSQYRFSGNGKYGAYRNGCCLRHRGEPGTAGRCCLCRDRVPA